MEITDELVQRVAHLARLSFNEEELPRMRQDMQRMIAFVEKLNELDTTGVEPLIHMSTETNVLREDIEANTLTQEEALANAPSRDSDYFKVPKVLRNPMDEG